MLSCLVRLSIYRPSLPLLAGRPLPRFLLSHLQHATSGSLHGRVFILKNVFFNTSVQRLEFNRIRAALNCPPYAARPGHVCHHPADICSRMALVMLGAPPRCQQHRRQRCGVSGQGRPGPGMAGETQAPFIQQQPAPPLSSLAGALTSSSKLPNEKGPGVRTWNRGCVKARYSRERCGGEIQGEVGRGVGFSLVLANKRISRVVDNQVGCCCGLEGGGTAPGVKRAALQRGLVASMVFE